MNRDGAKQNAVRSRGARLRRFAARAVQVLSWVYLFITLALWGLMHLVAEHAWFSTLLIYGPRWLWATPLPVLLLAAALLRRRSLWVLAVTGYILIWPIMDLCLPWRPVLSTPQPLLTFRVLTCNVHQKALNLDAMAALIARAQPDVVAIEECPRSVARKLCRGDGWNIVGDGELWTASRFPIATPQHLFPIENWGGTFATRNQLQTPAGALTFFTLHLESPHSVISAALRAQPGSRNSVEYNARVRLQEAKRLAENAYATPGAVLLAGDFNLPRDSAVYTQTFARFSDAFSTAGFGFGWTYRVKWTVTRIDHILTSGPLQCRRCWVAENVGSPHRPLIADFAWTPTSTAGRD